MRSKYALHPGFVNSKTDGERHFITATMLAKLYGVKITECLVCRADHPSYGNNNKELISLSPREDGNYDLPEKLK